VAALFERVGAEKPRDGNPAEHAENHDDDDELDERESGV
jgi:hypothetical protein